MEVTSTSTNIAGFALISYRLVMMTHSVLVDHPADYGCFTTGLSMEKLTNCGMISSDSHQVRRV